MPQPASQRLARWVCLTLLLGAAACGPHRGRGAVCDDVVEPGVCERGLFSTGGDCASSPCELWELELMREWQVCLCIDERPASVCDELGLTGNLTRECRMSSHLSDPN